MITLISLRIPHSVQSKLRFLLLTLFVISGLAVAWFEKGRPDESYYFNDLIKRGIHFFLNPVREKTSVAMGDFRSIRQLWKTEENNHLLRRQLNQSRIESQILREQLSRLARLTGLNRWGGPPELKFLSADVISVILDSNSASFVINLGRNDGLEPGDPVVALGGLAGVIRLVDTHTAHVQAVSDIASRVGAVAVPGRVRGVVYGGGRNKHLEFIPENEVLPVRKGDTLITSGFDNSIYPKGIIIGHVSGVELNDFGIPYGMVVPAVIPAQIEEVLMIVPSSRYSDDLPTTHSLGRFHIQMPRPEKGTATAGPGSLAQPADEQGK
jgi:rod shape-determining protein MreC